MHNRVNRINGYEKRWTTTRRCKKADSKQDREAGQVVKHVMIGNVMVVREMLVVSSVIASERSSSIRWTQSSSTWESGLGGIVSRCVKIIVSSATPIPALRLVCPRLRIFRRIGKHHAVLPPQGTLALNLVLFVDEQRRDRLEKRFNA